MRIFALSDIHGDERHFDAAAPLMESADVVVISGDLMRAYSTRSAERILTRIERHARRIIAVPGNWDRDEVRLLLDERGYDVHGRGRSIDGIGFFGVGGSGRGTVPVAGNGPGMQDIATALAAGYREITGSSRVVLVTHAPPFGSVDRSIIGLRGGSRAVSEFLDSHRVDLCLSGHIHEAFGVERHNGCVVANSGSFKSGHYTFAEVGDEIAVEMGKI